MSRFYGKTVSEAIENGLNELNLKKEEAEIKVICEETKGFFGITTKKAEVEINKISSDGEKAVSFLDGLFEILGITAKCNLKSEEDKLVIDVITDNSPTLIGYRGEVLDALQTLAGAVANIGKDDYRRVVVNCEGYREKREETLVALAKKLADKAVRTGRKVSLEPMNPYERRILHSALSDSTEVKTQSEGKEPNRFVVIIPNNLKPYDKNRKDGHRKDYGDKKDFAPKTPRPKTSGWGTFLGNSLKDDNN